MVNLSNSNMFHWFITKGLKSEADITKWGKYYFKVEQSTCYKGGESLFQSGNRYCKVGQLLQIRLIFSRAHKMM